MSHFFPQTVINKSTGIYLLLSWLLLFGLVFFFFFKAEQQSCLPSTLLIQYRRIRLSSISPISPWGYWLWGNRRRTFQVVSCLQEWNISCAMPPVHSRKTREESRTTWIEDEEEEEVRVCLYLRCLLCSLPSRWEREAGASEKSNPWYCDIPNADSSHP